MKLKNKKTGEVADFKIIADYDDCTSGWRLEKQDGSVLFYDFIDEIKEEWEDYAPKEPLIKQEKIRKAVRAWAEANEVSQQIQFDRYTSGFSASDDGHNILSMISFDGFVFNCEDGEYYTIDELCGEEE